ncbi:hypothetical protein [Marinomonas sp. GJ51-6]|uniref:hypothetical protein n=1 Tax=Marinomonas sp. GJ51-6 TaxID=2992802 RepID=UPI0029350D9C|nr:hypothetical protein [Marinomonas sp. GJ51-6]WOD08201.1 hypothetical protein ONZ50_03365 [Marinomonas sp. GJ51-6]
MSAFNVESCFGADINIGYFDINEILDIMEIKSKVLNSKRVNKLISLHGRKERIVSIAMRQVAFDILEPTLDSAFLPFDPYYVNDYKLLNNRHERLYDAQERFLILCMSIATGRSVKSLKKLQPDLNTKELRAKYARKQSLFRYFRQELNEHTRDYILSYKARMNDQSEWESSAALTTEEAPKSTLEVASSERKASLVQKNI